MNGFEEDGPKRSHRLQGKGEYLQVNQGLMCKAMQERERSHVGEAIQQGKWKQAMQAELDAIEKNGTWDLVSKPQKRMVIGVKRV